MNPLELINNFREKQSFESAKALNSYLTNHSLHQEHVLLLVHCYLLVLQANYGSSLKDELISRFNENILRHIDQLSTDSLYHFLNIHFGNLFEKEKMYKNLLQRKDKTVEIENFCIQEIKKQKSSFFTEHHEHTLKTHYLNPENIEEILKTISLQSNTTNLVIMKELCLKPNASFAAKNFVLQNLQEYKKSLTRDKKTFVIVSKIQKTILKSLGNSPKEEILKLLY